MLQINTIHKTNNFGDIIILESLRDKNNKIIYKCKFLNTNNICYRGEFDIRKGSIVDSKYEEESFISKIYPQKCGDDLKIVKKTDIKYKSNSYLYECEFQKYPCKVLAYKNHILQGQVYNYLYPSVCNKGYLGIGVYNKSIYPNIYNIWYNILSRCYNKKDKNYKNYGIRGIIVCKKWLNFQNFCQWYLNEKEKYYKNFEEKLDLDKDILANIKCLETKIYSPETCLLIPIELNGFLGGDNLKSGITKNIKNFQSKYNGIYLGSFNTFEEAKQVYAKEKSKDWIKLINKFDLPNDLRKILLKYNFKWNERTIFT